MKSMVTEEFLNTLAAKLNTKLTYRRYRMWDFVPHIGDTALVVDTVVARGGYKLVPWQEFPRKITPEYVMNAVLNKAYSLGRLDLSGEFSRFTPWQELVGSYPPGYFTHRVGEDVSGK